MYIIVCCWTYTYILTAKKTIDSIQMNLLHLFYSETNWMEWENVAFSLEFFEPIHVLGANDDKNWCKFFCVFYSPLSLYDALINWIQFPLQVETVCAVSVFSVVFKVLDAEICTVWTFYICTKKKLFGHWSTEAL